MAKSTESARAFAGFFVRKERWGLSWRGRFTFLLGFIALVVIGAHFIYGFLATTNRVGGEYIMVEGWIPAYAMKEVIALSATANYRGVITTGCLVPDQWGNTPTTTWADWGAGKLRKLGMPAERVTPVPCLESQRDRTFQSAAAAKRWFDEKHIALKSIDVVTLGPHGRRSRLLTEKAFGKGVHVGIISLEPHDYDPAHWWKSSEGIREVGGEAVGYLYARLLFWRSSNSPTNTAPSSPAK
jgi:uncharacterized SAM-binding protein YcdF (DUF218 family)